MVRPGPRSTYMEGNCWESQDCSRVVALVMKKIIDSNVHQRVLGVRKRL